jgi:hypothetical protein
MNVSEKNKQLVLEGFDTLFNKRDYTAAENRINTVLEGEGDGRPYHH